MEIKNRYKIIACINQDYALGNHNELLYHIRSDMKNFKSLTMNNVVIMGRNTFESLPNKTPLPNRVNIILTSQLDYKVEIDENDKKRIKAFENTYVVHSIEELDALCYAMFSDKELFIVGGSQLYTNAIANDMVDECIMTVINDSGVEADTYFPEALLNDFFEPVFTTLALRDHHNDLYYKYIIYKPKKLDE